MVQPTPASLIQKDRLIGQFIELVKIDSETKQEQEISKALQALFASLGFEVLEDDSKGKTGHGSGNLIMTMEAAPGGEQAEPVLFTCHMDTVVPGKGIKPRIDEDGYIRSDGTTILGSDDKAGIAALVEAVRAVKEQQLPHSRLQIVITAGEESGLVGSRSMDPKHLQAKYGFALDSNGKVGSICIAAPAQAKIFVTIFGKSAHAGVNPEDGISAIQVAGRAIARMPLGRIDHETTANIGSFEGKVETNVVCEMVKIAAEARSLVGEKLERQVEAMRSAFEQTAQEFGARAEFTYNVIYPAYKHDEQSEIVQIAKRAVQSVGLEPATFFSGGGSDANVFNGLGVPTVNMAVGYEQIHTTKEQIAVEDLVKTAEVALALIRESAATKI